MFFAPLDSPPGAYPKPTSDVLYVACGWLILRRMSCMVQVALQINISRFAESTEVLVLTYSLNPQTANTNSDKPFLCYSDTQCKMSPCFNVSLLYYTWVTMSLKHTTVRHPLRLRNVYWNSKFVIIAPIAMETRLGPKPTGIISVWVYAHYPLRNFQKKLSGRVTPPL